jgi:hypothetical protein
MLTSRTRLSKACKFFIVHSFLFKNIAELSQKYPVYIQSLLKRIWYYTKVSGAVNNIPWIF